VIDAPPADDILARLQAAGPGELVWLPVNGRSCAPLLRPGQSAGFERCAEDALRRGDLVLVRRGGTWAVRVVASTGPLRTGTARGAMDEHAGEVHARVAVIRRGGRTLPFGSGRRAAAWAMQRAATTARRALRPAARFVTSSRATGGVRGRRVGPLRVRRVMPEDAAALDAFAAEHLPRTRDLIVRQSRGRWAREGAAVAAFDAQGTVRGFIFLDEYAQEGVPLAGHWLRSLAVDPWARRLGLGRELVREVCAEAHRRGVRRVYADVLPGNVASLALLRGLGFVDADATVADEADRLFAAAGKGRRVILEATLPLSAPAE
jgi:ribosomal protein S18 acetylase RimI-like enzyme